MKDNELKLNKIYWVEIIDQSLKELFSRQMKCKFTGILFRSVENEKQTFFLSQLKIFREAT